MNSIVHKFNTAREITDEMIVCSAKKCLARNGGKDGIIKLKKLAQQCTTKTDYLNFFTGILNINAEESENGIILHLNKTECSCPMASQLNIDKSRLCDCTEEREKYMWSEVFCKKVDIHIVESFWRGGNDCVLELIL